MPDPTAPVTLDKIAPHIALVTLNRPEARNAISAAATHAMHEIVDRTEADPDIWITILTGAGEQAFCAGADLKEVWANGFQALTDPERGFASFVYARRDKPWIAAVNGPAVAGGCEIALACDMIIATESAVFGLPEVKRGLLAAAGGVFRLPRALPRAIAMELIATGETLPAARALDYGLVNRVVPRAALIETALELAGRIAVNAPLAVREAMRIARQAMDESEQTLARLSFEAQDRLALTSDFREGPLAFIEKRPPRWTGR